MNSPIKCLHCGGDHGPWIECAQRKDPITASECSSDVMIVDCPCAMCQDYVRKWTPYAWIKKTHNELRREREGEAAQQAKPMDNDPMNRPIYYGCPQMDLGAGLRKFHEHDDPVPAPEPMSLTAAANLELAKALQSLSESIRSMAFSVDALAQTQKPEESNPLESAKWSPDALSKMLAKDAVPFEFPKLRSTVEVESPRVKVMKLEEGRYYVVQDGVVIELDAVKGPITDGEMSPFWLWLHEQEKSLPISKTLRTILNNLLRSRGVG